MMAPDGPRPASTTATTVPVDLAILGLVALMSFGLWATSTKLLVASDRQNGSTISSCTHFTGVPLVERQYRKGSGEAPLACPFVDRAPSR